MSKTTLDIGKIETGGGTQMRAEIDQTTIVEYVAAMDGGAEFPPVTVFFDGAKHWLADGFHRYYAARRAGWKTIDAEVRKGEVRDAILYAAGANSGHGLRRTNADKRKAVEALLADDEWRKWSDRRIAEACGVGHAFVSNVRGSLLSTVDSDTRTYTTKHGTTATMDVSRIGERFVSTATGEVMDKPELVRIQQQASQAALQKKTYYGFGELRYRDLMKSVSELREYVKRPSHTLSAVELRQIVSRLDEAAQHLRLRARKRGVECRSSTWASRSWN